MKSDRCYWNQRSKNAIQKEILFGKHFDLLQICLLRMYYFSQEILPEDCSLLPFQGTTGSFYSFVMLS